jgi:hypothetical protein
VAPASSGSRDQSGRWDADVTGHGRVHLLHQGLQGNARLGQMAHPLEIDIVV